MWEADTIDSSENHTRFIVLQENEPISYFHFLELLRDKKSFRTFYNNHLKSLSFEGFFWENKPVTKQSLSRSYECSIINSKFLARKSPDFHMFKSHFRQDQSVVSFPNLGNDAHLIAPCPPEKNSGYAHIGSFIRGAPKSQIHELWKRTGEEMLNRIGEKPKWLSTSGLGVFWVHVRIDSVPKYYQTKEYKTYN